MLDDTERTVLEQDDHDWPDKLPPGAPVASAAHCLHRCPPPTSSSRSPPTSRADGANSNSIERGIRAVAVTSAGAWPAPVDPFNMTV
jgi:hypothetical protein